MTSIMKTFSFVQVGIPMTGAAALPPAVPLTARPYKCTLKRFLLSEPQRSMLCCLQDVTCEISKSGVKFAADHHKSLEAKAFFNHDLFQSFFYADDDGQTFSLKRLLLFFSVLTQGVRAEPTSFSVNLGVLLECLTIFGSSSSATLKMSYVG